ncbi:MAG: hypothetical protein NTV61_03010 [Candidatus Bathyarchaeota archaeon]|nr:hypothetical protein [Candidatus Bathyarchaeota archaeon]
MLTGSSTDCSAQARGRPSDRSPEGGEDLMTTIASHPEPRISEAIVPEINLAYKRG